PRSIMGRGKQLNAVGKYIIKEQVAKYKPINTANEKLFDGESYVQTVREDRVLNYLEHRNMISKEVVFTPPGFVAHLTAKSKFGRMGLSFLNAAKVHSGFVGRLALELVNLSNERVPITVNRGAPLIHIEFLRREGDPSPYDGAYMFQYMNDKEVDIYTKMMAKYFGGVFPEAELREKKEKRVQESRP